MKKNNTFTHEKKCFFYLTDAFDDVMLIFNFSGSMTPDMSSSSAHFIKTIYTPSYLPKLTGRAHLTYKIQKIWAISGTLRFEYLNKFAK